jgi:Domain of unknown function (DUF4160)/Protein of unknown function (DUF2442)
MYYNDHGPPHFHVVYNEFKAVIGINDLSILFGDLPPKAVGLVMEWALLHKASSWRTGIFLNRSSRLVPLPHWNGRDGMYFDVTQAKLGANHLVTLEFEDGSVGRVDLRTYVQEGTVFSKLKDPAYMQSMRIEYGTLVWGQGEVDIAPEALYEQATGRSVSYGGKDRAVS